MAGVPESGLAQLDDELVGYAADAGIEHRQAAVVSGIAQQIAGPVDDEAGRRRPCHSHPLQAYDVAVPAPDDLEGGQGLQRPAAGPARGRPCRL